MVKINLTRLFLILWMALIFSFLSHSQTVNNFEENEIRDYLKRQQDCWNLGNLECFMEYYWKSDSLRFVGKDGITYGWQSTLDRYKKRYPSKLAMGHLDFEVLSFEFHNPKTVLIIGKWHLSRETKDIEGYFSLIWKKIKGRWMIVIDHTS